jgi:hypothetical protein
VHRDRHGLFRSRDALAAVLANIFALLASGAWAHSIIDEWAMVKVPPPPELKKVTIDPKTTALLVMGFVRDSCNMQRRPRCAATIPAVAKLLAGARAHGVFVMHSVPSTNPTGDYIVKDLVPLPGEGIIPPNGPNKFLPVDPEFPQFADFALDKILHDKASRQSSRWARRCRPRSSTLPPRPPCAAMRSSFRSTACRATASIPSNIPLGT